MNRAELKQEPAVHAHWPAKPYIEREGGPSVFFGTPRAPRGMFDFGPETGPTLNVSCKYKLVCLRIDTEAESFKTFISPEEARCLALALLDAACAVDDRQQAAPKKTESKGVAQ